MSRLTEDPEASPELREKLKTLAELLEFAQHASLDIGDSYQYYIDNKTEGVSYLVQAAYPDRLEFKTWWFPIVGEVPYLGYFDETERNSQAEALESEGFDVHLGLSGAYSGLGYIPDPLYASMIDGSYIFWGQTILHELVHLNLWVPGSVTFNEQLAEYVSQGLMGEYLRARGTPKDSELFLLAQKDEALFSNWVSELKFKLQNLYSNPGALPKAAILAEKARIYSKAQGPDWPKFSLLNYAKIKEKSLNNATLMAIGLYIPDQARFAKAKGCAKARDWGEFLSLLKGQAEKGLEGFLALDSLCTSEPT